MEEIDTNRFDVVTERLLRRAAGPLTHGDLSDLRDARIYIERLADRIAELEHVVDAMKVQLEAHRLAIRGLADLD